MGAGAATAAPLSDGYKRIGEGAGAVEIWRTGESAMPGQSMAGNGVGRSAVLSGKVVTRFGKAASGNLRVGYLVGCQVSIGRLSAGISGTVTAVGPSATGSISFPLAPGQIKAVQLSTQPVSGGTGMFKYSDVEVEVQGCGGFAQARSYAQVEVVDGYSIDTAYVAGSGAYVQSVLYGKPFSLN
ncbi:hypothetical protein DLJ61_05095 [Gordonia terrae]|uniref:MspA n=2 Tax=Gordonia terrae TaxID=2055 RepID=A0AAD0KFU9_9ACTN|nr:hypothetical protein DLJ61_05095 [Gordonia terrae]